MPSVVESNMSHTMKLWERVVERTFSDTTRVNKNQFCFIPGRSTMRAIFLLRRVMKIYRERKKDMQMVFIDLEKAYYRVPRKVFWWVLEEKLIHVKYINVTKNMYERAVTSVPESK